ncbi:5'/3'-nucleotidase SurE [Longispora sp. K20-0274]|uniref:5'/3'-nucleotidase SurE n=1 Tax=Longispora sp. K20-0274 TaxID=3088255 RepID=UPI00399BA2BA
MSTLALVTNDDGIDSPGLTALADAARAHGFDVVVAAPAGPASGMSAALTAVEHGGHIGMRERSPGVYAVEATPAMISLLAVHGAFGRPPDVVLSGINRGANIGRAILHSGTVGAALTAAYHGVPALAVSLDVGLEPAGPPRWDTAAAVTRDVLPRLADLAPGTVVNLNVPDAPTVPGVRETGLATFGTVQITLAETGEGFVRTQLTDTPRPGSDEDCDLALLARGWATLTLVEGITAAFAGPPGRVGGRENGEEHAMPRAWSAKRLYEEAKKKNIKGRSTMTKAQLERAVGR